MLYLKNVRIKLRILKSFMRPLRDMTIIQIEVTNACYLKCANCTRHVGHHNKPFL